MKYFFLFFLFIVSCISKEHETDKPDKILKGVNNIFISQVIDGRNESRKVIIHANNDPIENFSYPIVFFLHGNGGNADRWINPNLEYVDHHEFIGIYPQGFKNSWNLGQEKSNANDIEFFNLIMQQILSYSNIDLDKIFAVGTSNGSGMVNELAINTSFFKGIAPIASQLSINQIKNKDISPLSIYQVCGSDDETIPYKGGISRVGHTFMSANESIMEWVKLINCNEEYALSIVESDSLFTFTNCKEKNQVVHRRVEGGNHNLSGRGRFIINDIWNFFKSLD